jgi:polar amino acid transport system substrate-binding protein
MLFSLKKLALTLVMFLTFGISYADPTEKIEYYTEVFPPFNFSTDGGQATGMNTDLVIEMFKAVGSKKTYKDIIVAPWARGYSLAKDSKKLVALYSTTRTAARENLFKWVGPLSRGKNGLFVQKGNPKKVTSPATTGGKPDSKFTYGVIRSDLGELLLTEKGLPESSLSRVAKFNQLVKLLKSGRIDTISYNPTVGMWLLKSMNEDTSKYELVFEEVVGEHYIAFNNNVSDEVIAAHQEALDKIMANKSLVDGIRGKYR